jgi:cytidylate kinase
VNVVAIDGVLGSGKTTVARLVAAKVGLEYLDTGAMYRCVALGAVRAGIDLDAASETAGPARDEVVSIARRALIEVGSDGSGEQVVRLDGETVTFAIRQPDVAKAASMVAKIADVRSELVSRQRSWAHSHGGGVLEGRDIASVVFPDAATRIFLTADVAERARRRFSEQNKLTYEEVLADLQWRDNNDQSREVDPLRIVDGATVVDTTGQSVDQVVDQVAELIRQSQTAQTERVVPTEQFVPTEQLAVATPVASAAVTITPIAPVENAAEPKELATKAKSPSVAGDLGKPWTNNQRRVFEASRVLVVPLISRFFRVQYRGLENMPTTGAFILAPSHRSNVDFILLPGLTKRRMRFLGKDSIWKFKIFGSFFDSLGGIPVRRGTTDRESMRICSTILSQGEPLVIFPEGARKAGPVIEELFDGAAFLASKHNAPIVPVGIGGSDKAMPKGAKFPRRVRLTVVVGEPIPAPTGGRSAIRTTTATLRSEIQALFDEASAGKTRGN